MVLKFLAKCMQLMCNTHKVIGVLEYVIKGGESAVSVVQSNSFLLLVAQDKHMT